jgi:hypothetical protein
MRSSHIDQISLFDGNPARDAGIQQAIDHAEKVSPGWKEAAIEYFRTYPGQVFMTEQVRAFAYANGFSHPPTEKAWGSVASEAASRGIIKSDGHGPVNNKRAVAVRWKKVSS